MSKRRRKERMIDWKLCNKKRVINVKAMARKNVQKPTKKTQHALPFFCLFCFSLGKNYTCSRNRNQKGTKTGIPSLILTSEHISKILTQVATLRVNFAASGPAGFPK